MTETYPLDQFMAAFAALTGRKAKGKVVLTMTSLNTTGTLKNIPSPSSSVEFVNVAASAIIQPDTGKFSGALPRTLCSAHRLTQALLFLDAYCRYDI